MEGSDRGRIVAGFSHPMSFWSGAAAVTVGVLLQLPMYFNARHQHFVLRGMPMDPEMLIGMVLMVVGLALVAYGLVVRSPSGSSGKPRGTSIDVRALDGARISTAHIRLMVVLAVAIAIDTLKPYTFTFILPGVAKEYGLSSPAHHVLGHAPVALLPFFGILGTALGSFVWGYLGDKMGRRASMLLASMIFIGSSACGAMPAFWENQVMCFIMGLAVGGFLPIAYSLLVETVPSERRGQVVVLVAGVGTAAGFLLASLSAHWLIPLFNWRVMWFLGIPTGVALIALNQFMPESPRFLLAMGRDEEALAIMRTFGAAIVEAVPGEGEDGMPAMAYSCSKSSVRELFHRPFTGLTSSLVLYGLAWGVVSFGFIVWLPTDVASARTAIDQAQITAILSEAAVFSIPGAVFAAWLYGRSAKVAMVFFSATCAASLGLFAVFGSQITSDSIVLTTLLVVLLVSMWGSISVLCPYSAEVYPTRMRSSGAGIAAGASKLGGVVALALAVLAISPPSLTGAAGVSAAPMLAAAVAIAVVGVETARRSLDRCPPRGRNVESSPVAVR